MNVSRRIYLSRLIEKAEQNKEMSEKLGIINKSTFKHGKSEEK